MLPVLQIGPLALQTPGLILLLGVWLGLTLVERGAVHRRPAAEALYNLALTVLVAGVVGARLAYAARYPEAFLASPASLISLNPGLLDMSGGVAVGLIAGLIYGQRKGMPLSETLGALTPGLAVIMIALALADLASGNAFGAPSDLPWAIELWGARRHPSQIYAALAAGGILWYLWQRRKQPSAPGTLFLQFVALSAAARLFLEAFRGDSLVLFAGLRQAQIVAWVVLAASLWELGKMQKAKSD